VESTINSRCDPCSKNAVIEHSTNRPKGFKRDGRGTKEGGKGGNGLRNTPELEDPRPLGTECTPLKKKKGGLPDGRESNNGMETMETK